MFILLIRNVPLKLIWFSLFFIFLSKNLAQDQSSYLLQDDVIVSASRYEEDPYKAPEAISVLDQGQILFTSPMNATSSLFGTNGIWMQQTNNGGGSPFVRGLTGNQTLIMIDGIRLNNSTFRYGPNQYLNTININSIQRVEVMRGSGSVQYGSDALGGTVHFITKAPSLNSDGNNYKLGVNGKYLSDNMEKSGFIDFDYSGESFAFNSLVSYKNFGDIVAGGDLGKEIPSSYNELAANLKSLFKITDSYLLTLSYDYVKQSDVNRFDQVTQRGYEYYKFDPQVRQLAYLKNNFKTYSEIFNDINLTISWQKSDETRKKKKENSSIQTIENDKVNVFGTNLEIISLFSKSWKASSGAELYYDYVNSSKEIFDVLDNSRTSLRGLYADGSTALNFSLYSLYNILFGNFDINFGLRYNANSIDIKDEMFGDVSISPMALTGHASIQYYVTDFMQFIGRINTAYRTPNINDLSSFGSFDYGIEVPNNDLSPEQSLNFEVGLKTRANSLTGSLFIYRNNLSNLIDRVGSTYNGDLTYQGEKVYTKVNVGEAFIQGIEGDVTYQFSRIFSIYSFLNYTYGQNISKDEPMRRIPPLNGNLSIIYNYNSVKLSVEYLFASKQDRLSSGDIDDHRIPDGGTPGWQVLNLYGSYRFDSFLLSTGLLNIFNVAYRTHGSGIDGIGRSLFVAIHYQFK